MEHSSLDVLWVVLSHFALLIYIMSFPYCACEEFEDRNRYGVTFKVVIIIQLPQHSLIT